MRAILISVLPLLLLSCSKPVDRTIQPKPGPAPVINLGKPKTFELKNKLKVIVVENHKLPKISATLSIDNPPVLEGEKAGLSDLTGSLLGTGTKLVSKDDFNEEVDFLGASIAFWGSGAAVDSLTRHFPRVLELMADALISPVFTQKELEKVSSRLIANIKSTQNDVSSVAARVQNALVYGKNHPYGEFPTEQTVGQVGLSDVEAFHKAHFRPNNAYLVVVGDTTVEQVEKLVSKYFSKWEEASIAKASLVEAPNVKTPEIDFVDMPHAVQSDISVVSTVNLKMRDNDYHAVLMANQLLGGDFNSYLNMNLREKNGYTYGAGSRMNIDKYVSSFRAQASVRNAVTGPAIVETLNEIKRLRETSVTAENLQTAKSAYIGSFVLALEDPKTIARFALKIKTEGLAPDFYDKYLENINKVTISDVKRVALKYFTLDNMRVVVVGKGTQVLADLMKLPYPVKYFDSFAEPIKDPKPESVKAPAALVE